MHLHHKNSGYGYTSLRFKGTEAKKNKRAQWLKSVGGSKAYAAARKFHQSRTVNISKAERLKPRTRT
jgi:hypothetical protein